MNKEKIIENFKNMNNLDNDQKIKLLIDMGNLNKKTTVTQEEVNENMKDVLVRTLDDFGKPTTYVTVRMKNGFTVRESTTCVDPENYSEEIGKEICLKKIEDKIWFLLGYSLQDINYELNNF